MEERNEILTYFRSNIFEAKTSYNAWKMLYCSKSKNIVGEKMADRYVKIQKNHNNFFGIAERSFFISWVILILHAFDKNNKSYSLKKVDLQLYDSFLSEHNNQSMIDNFKTVRDKLLAHRDGDVKPEDRKMPSIDETDKFFDRLEEFYNKLCGLKENSSTSFQNTEEVKRDTERLFINVERGENIRLKEIDIKYNWEEDDNKVSNKI